VSDITEAVFSHEKVNMEAKIHVLVGMIASGKSTYCKTAAQKGSLIMNDDAIVALVHADDYTLYDKKLKILYKSVENHIIALGIALNKLVVVDRGLNVSVRGRKRWIALAHSFDVPCEAISFPNEGPAVHAERRAKGDGRGHGYDYWLKVAEAHNSVYAPPSLDEGFDAVHHITFDEIKKGTIIS
jgi:predicted kinase